MKIIKSTTSTLLVSLTCFLSFSSAHAEHPENDGHGHTDKADHQQSNDGHPTSTEKRTVTNAWADCGIGASISPDNASRAIISNVLWDLGTTALSSQTSSPSSCKGATVTAAIFIDKTYPILEEQFVKGGGTHVAALMDILQCGESAHQNVIQSVQTGLASSFQEASFASETQLSKAIKMSALVDQATASCNA